MVNPFEETLQAGTVNPREQAALSMRDAGIGSLGARSTLPRFTDREEAIARGHGGHPDQLWDQKINKIISEGHQKQDRWEELGGPNYSILAPGKTLNMPQYPVLNKGKIGPGWLEAGIPATNQGYKVWNASDPTGNDGWIDRLGRWLFNDPYDKESDESLYQGTEQDKLESEYGTEGTGEFYPDKILRDLYPQYFGGLESEDLGMEQLPLEASGDSYNIMAGELIRSGLFDPVEIQNMDSYELQQNYENTFGSESDAMQMSLNLQDAMDAHEALGLSLNTDRFTRRANKAGVQVTNRGGIMGLV